MPEPAETLYADPIFEDYAHAQIIVRDLYNMLVMQEERAVGHVFFNPDYVSPQVLRTRPPEPGSYIPARGGSGEDLSRAFFKGPSADGDRQMNDHIDKHISRARENVGATPAIWGGGGPEPTARATEIKKNQALQQLNTTWNEMRRFWEDTTYKATMIMAELSGGKFYFPRAGGVLEMVEINNVWKLREGGWRFHAEESFPLTAGQRRDVLMQLLGMPQVHTLLGFGPPVPLSMVNPAAIERIQEAVGLPDLETPGKSEKLRLLGIIAKLRELPMQIDPMTGMPAPAVLPDTMLFDAQFAVRVIKDWMLGESGVAAEENDQEWYEHVRMFMQSWQMVLQQQIMAAQQQAMIAAGADADSGAEADGEGEGLNQSPPSPGVESDPLAGSQPPAGDGAINPPPQLAIQ